MKINNIVTREYSLFESMSAGTDTDTQRVLRNMQENFVVPYTTYLNRVSQRLTEAELNPEQITQLFGTVTQGAQQAGGNETMLGKMMPDAIKQKFVDNLPEPDAGEVPEFQTKATAAVQQVQDPATKQSLMQLIKTGLQNPATQKLIIAGVQGVVGIAAGALTGGVGGKLGATAAGAITGGLVGLIAAKLQGQDWKTAGKAGLKGAAMGAGGALVGSVASGMAAQAMSGTPTTDSPDSGITLPAADQAQNQAAVTQAAKEWSAADPAEKAQIEQATSMTANQLAAAADPVRNIIDPSTPSNSSYQQAAPTGADGTPMQQVPMDQPYASSSKVRANLDQWRTDTGSPNAPVVGQNFDSGIAPTGADGTPMQQVPADQPYASSGKVRANLDQWRTDTGSPNAPVVGQNFDSGIAPTGADGTPMQQVPMDQPASQGTSDQVSFIDLTDDRSGTMNLPDGTSIPVNLFPEGGLQPRLPGGTQQIKTEVNGQPVTAWIYGGKAYVKNYKAEGIMRGGNQLTEYVDRDLTIRMWALHERLGTFRGGVHLTEAGIGSMINSIGSWLKTKGQNLTQTVTTDKLMQAWDKAGKPTDSDKIADLLQTQGIAPDVLDAAFKSMSIPRTLAPVQAPAIASTGGTSQQTSTGQQHTARANNPNQSATPAPAAAAPAPAAAAPAAAPAAPAAPAAAAPAAPAAAAPTGASIFANPTKLAAAWEAFADSGANLPPQSRGVMKDILLTALRTVESRTRRMSAIINESKRISKELSAIKKIL